MITASLLSHIAAVSALALAGPAPTPAGMLAQIQQSEGHYHEGELGEKYLYVESRLKCNCGCGLDVHSCQFQMQCGTSPAWSERIRLDLERGVSVEAIEASFVADFGPTVLMSPPAEGFNLVGYLLPTFAIVISGVLVGLVIRGGAGKHPEVARVMDVTDEEEDRLREELRRIEEAESPDW